MKKRLGIVLFAGALLFLFINSEALAKKVTESISVRFADIKLVVNGQEIKTNAEPFIYEGNVYAPVATIANALNVKQWWDNETPAVQFNNYNRLQDEVDYYYTSKANYSEMGRVGGRTIYMFEDWIAQTTTLLENDRAGEDPISYSIPILEIEGYESIESPYDRSAITRSFVSYNHFFMINPMLNKETEKVDIFLHLLYFDYKNNEVVSFGSKQIESSDKLTKYSGDVIDHKLYLNNYLYNENLKEYELVEIDIYSWDQEGQIDLVDTFTKDPKIVNE